MILGIGIDIVDVNRFESWAGFSQEKLSRVFTQEELIACEALPKGHDKVTRYSCPRLASRFAAKEAFYKALSAMLVKLGKTGKTFSFFSCARYIEVSQKEWGVPELVIDWDFFEEKIHGGVQDIRDIQIDLSVSHEKQTAIAFVVISSFGEV